MNRRFLVSGTILRLETRCNLPPAPGLEALSKVHLAQALALFLRLALTLALVLAGEIGGLGEIPG